eukprot:7479542-Alexandrium_andersonii.AAC.1
MHQCFGLVGGVIGARPGWCQSRVCNGACCVRSIWDLPKPALVFVIKHSGVTWDRGRYAAEGGVGAFRRLPAMEEGAEC